MNILSLLGLLAVLAIGCGKTQPPAPPPPPPAPAAAPAPAELPAGHPPIGGDNKLPAGHPPIDMAAQQLPPDAIPASANPQWTVPGDWEAGRASSVRRGSWTVAGNEGQTADIAVTVFPGDVGGPLANLNRWRGQIGLEPIADLPASAAAVTVDGMAARVDDIANAATGQQVVVVTVPRAGNSWFFKMTGPTAVVAAQKAALLKFAQSVKF